MRDSGGSSMGIHKRKAKIDIKTSDRLTSLVILLSAMIILVGDRSSSIFLMFSWFSYFLKRMVQLFSCGLKRKGF
jgi:hypothetical protein